MDIYFVCRNVLHVNTLKPRQDGRHLLDDIFQLIFFNENISI